MRVVELSSFALAAKQLGMSAAAVTRSVNMLEAHLNMRLINRSTRNLSLTEAGTEYLDGCRSIISSLDEIESNLVKIARSPHGTMRIAASTTFAAAELGPLLAAYREAHPRVDFDVTTFDAHIDMIEGAFDVGFTADNRFVSASMVSRVLASFENVLVASPSYLARRGVPANPSMLASHELLVVSDGAARIWEFTDADGVYRVSSRHSLRTSSHAMARIAALNHMGIAMLPAPAIRHELDSGMLLQVLAQYPVSDDTRHFSIVYSGRNHLTTKVRTFVEFSVDRYRANDRMIPLRAVA